jgi:hypothetical protein
MPIDVASTVILAGILFGFTAFAAALMWADIQTRRTQRQS